MSLLFENLQALNEASKLEERNAFNPQTYIEIKRALNKDNPIKDKLFLNTDLPGNPTDKFKFGLNIFATNRENLQDWQIERGYDGRGTKIGTYYINTIDETATFKSYDSSLMDSVKRIAYDTGVEEPQVRRIISDGLLNLEKLFNQKNFYYRLTNKRNKDDKYGGTFNLKDEKVEPKIEETTPLTEDFDPSMPNWLMKAIRQEGTEYNGYVSTGLPLDTMKWEITAPPTSGKLPSEYNDVIACLIDVSGENRTGNYLVYAPKLGLNSMGTIRVNQRDRKIATMSMKALAPYIKEFAIAKDVEAARKDVSTKRDDRFNVSLGAPKRVANKDQNWTRTYDKSGYLVDPNKYTKMLSQIHQQDYADRLEDLYVVISGVKSKIQSYVSSDDFLPDAKGDKSPYSVDYGTKASKFIKEINTNYNRAISAYRYALEDLENIQVNDGENKWNSTPAFKSFNDRVAEAEAYIAKVLNTLEPKNN